MRAQQRGHHPGRPDVGQVSHHPVAVAGVLSAGLGQVGRDRGQLDVAACFALLAWVLKGWPSTRLALALDATSLGDRFTVLAIGVVYRGGAIPVAWKVLPGNVARAWKPEWIALLREFSGLVPPGSAVLVMTDRGLYARWLYREIVALGWHPLMRITRLSKFREAGSTSSVAVTALVPAEGRRWRGRGLAFPRGPGGGWSARSWPAGSRGTRGPGSC